MRPPQCGCVDTCCPAHLGGHCVNLSTQTLYRVDQMDESGTDFCDACAEDAHDTGVFSCERVVDGQEAENEPFGWSWGGGFDPSPGPAEVSWNYNHGSSY